MLLMNFPLSLSNREPNNVWMSRDDARIDQVKACRQWMALYEYVSQHALIYVLPGHDNLQDLPYVANLGCYLPHMVADTVVLSKFTSVPRQGEEEIGRRFFKSFRYIVEQPPACFEGEADLKWIRDDIYVGGVGQRSTREAFEWMRERYGMTIIEIELTDPKLYHLDCVFMKLNNNTALVNASVLSSPEIHALANVVDIVPVPRKHKYHGWTNSLVLNGQFLTGSPTFEGTKLKFFDLSEFDKSGADLSCLFMRLNHK